MRNSFAAETPIYAILAQTLQIWREQTLRQLCGWRLLRRLQRITPQRNDGSILEALTHHAEDATDHNLPLMYWYAMEPLADVDPPRALALALSAGEKIPILKEFMIRRIGAGDPAKSLDLLVDGLSKAKDDATRLTFLRGLNESLKGRQRCPAAQSWQQVKAELAKADSGEVQIRIDRPLRRLRRSKPPSIARQLRILDAKASAAQHRAGDRRAEPDPIARACCRVCLTSSTRGTPQRAFPARTAQRSGFAAFDDARIPPAILGVYGELSSRPNVATPSPRSAAGPTYASALLDAVAAGKVPSNHLTADLVTNLRNLNDATLNKRIEQVWGIVRTSPEDKKKLIDDYKQLLGRSLAPH